MVVRSFSASGSGGIAASVYDVCGVGNAIVDVVAESDDVFLRDHGVAKGGMTLIDEARAESLYAAMGAGVEMSGGSVANTVAAIASLGGSPCYIGKVRDDQLGEIFRHDLLASGVYYATMPSVHGPATARCLILVTPDAQRSMNTFLGACVDLGPEDIDVRQVASAAVTFLEGYLFDKPKAQEAFYLAARHARLAGRRVALTLSDTFCVERHREAFLAFAREEVDCLLSNEFELMALYQASSVEAALDLARAECGLVVATRSEKGALIAAGGQTYSVDAVRGGPVLDTTGAGDLFAAGFLFGLTHGYDLPVCGRMGAIAAAEVIGHYGARPQVDLKALMRQQGIVLP